MISAAHVARVGRVYGRVRTLAALAALLTLAGCLERGPASAPTLEPLEVSVGSRWLRDRRGRVVLLRGATYTVSETGMDGGGFGGPVENTLAEMERLGMNLVRLPLSWALIEPQPDRPTIEYLRMRVDPVVRLAAAHGLSVVLSMRPWPRGPCDGSDPTIPDWVCTALQTAPGPKPSDPSCAFWRSRGPNKVPLRTHYAKIWSLVAHRYGHDARVVGFDVLDEPTAGTCFGATPFEAGHLRPYYQLLERKIRDAAPGRALLYQPPLNPGAHPAAPRSPGAPLVFSPHIWSQRIGPPPGNTPDALAAAYATASREAAQLETPLLVGEYGGDLPATPDGFRPSSAAFLLHSLAALDRHLASGAFYALRPKSQAVAVADFGRLETALSRPFARRIAGIPTAMAFLPAAREFTLRFEDDAEHAPPDPTEIFLPNRVYGDDFEVELDPPGRWTFDAHTQRLLVHRGPGTSHEVRVRPRAPVN